MSSPKYLWTIGCALGMFSGLGTYATPARAGVLYQGWNYSIDSFNDGLDGEKVGINSGIELYGMAMKEEGDSLYFAFNSNLSLDGLPNRRAFNRSINYGDLFLNFSSVSSSNSPRSYGIRFDTGNDSRLTPGLYQNVSGISVSRANGGFASLAQTHDAIAAQGGTVSYGDEAVSYFDLQDPATTTLYQGTYLGGVDLLGDTADLGLDFSAFGATGLHTFGLRVDRSLLPSGDLIANLFVESGNDGVALQGGLSDRSALTEPPNQTIPEPSSLISLGLLGLVEISRRVWKQLHTEVVF